MENKKEEDNEHGQINLPTPNLDNESAHGQGIQSNRSQKKNAPPASVYHNIARMNNQQIITSGVLGNRHGNLQNIKQPVAAIDNASVEKEKPTDQGQKIISTSIRVKNENNKGLWEQKIGDQQHPYKNSVDHSSLFIQNSPRQSKVTASLTAPGAVSYNGGSIQPVSTTHAFYGGAHPQNYSNLNGQDQEGSHLADTTKRMNPIFYKRKDEDSEERQSTEQLQFNPHFSNNGGGIHSPRFANRLNTQHATKRPKGLMPESTDTKKWESPNQGSMIQSRTGTHAELADVNSGSAGQIKGNMVGSFPVKQVNSMVEGKLFTGAGSPQKQTIVELRSHSPVQTQKGAGLGQSSTYSAAGEKISLYNNNDEVKVDISSVKASSNQNATQNPPSISNDPQFGYSQYDNPFNVQSFLPKPRTGQSPVKAEEEEVLKQRVQPSETDATSQQRNPTKVEVFKVYDLIKGEGGYSHHRRGASPHNQTHNTSKSEREARENLIKQVMRQPKVTNYEQLKRSRPDNTTLPSVTTPDSTTVRNQVVYSQRDSHSIKNGLITPQNQAADQMQFGQVKGSLAQTHRDNHGDHSQYLYKMNHRAAATQGSKPHTMTQQGFRKMPMSKKGISHHQRLASQGTTPRPPIMPTTHTNPSTPSRASKRFVGGFGGAGSIYTHSHLTQTRKISHYRIASTQEGVSNTQAHTQRWPNRNSNDQHRLKSQEAARAYNKSPGQANTGMDSVDLMVAGNKTGSQGMISSQVYEQAAFRSVAPGSLYQISGQQAQNLSHLESETEEMPFLPQTSRSPVPIDPETYKDMHKFLPRRMDTSANELQKGTSREASPGQRSLSMSSNEQAHINADLGSFTQVKPFIMSPQNLQDTLRKQQEAIRAEKESLNTPGGVYNGIRTQNNSSIRNVYTQHGKRSKGSQYRLQGNFGKPQPHTSSIGLSVESVNNLTAKRFAPSTEHFSTSHIANGVNQEQQTSQPSVKHGLPYVEGKKLKDNVPHTVNIEHLVRQNKAGLSQEEKVDRSGFEQVTAGTVASPRQGLASNDSFDDPINNQSDVGMRISKVNIEVKTQAKNEGQESDQKSQYNNVHESRDRRNFSNMTNLDRTKKGTIFEENGTLGPQGDQSLLDEVSPGLRKFKPVLKSKSYLNNSQNSLASPPDPTSPQNGQIINFVDEPQFQQVITADVNTVDSKVEDAEFFQMNDGNANFGAQDESLEGKNEQTSSRMQMQEICQQQKSSTTGRDHSELDQGSRSMIGDTAMDVKLQPTYQTKSDFQIGKNADVDVAHSYLKYEKRDSQASADTSQVDEATLNNMLRVDENTLAQCRQKKDFGVLDFVALKTQEFLHYQKKFGNLDYNSLNSDRKANVQTKADILMKDIALSSRKKYSRLVGGDGQELFDINERKNMQINCQVPVNMIKFKNKSEQMRYMRIATCILALNDKNQQKSQNDIEFTYMKIFRFLADMLTAEEFKELSYFHVSRFISNILRLAFEEDSETVNSDRVLNPVSLHQFVCESLDLKYRRTAESHTILQKANQNLNSQREPLPVFWTKHAEPAKVDLYKIYSQRSFVPKSNRSLGGNSESRHHQIQDHITRQVKSFAHEPRLQNVIRSTYFKEKETIKRENLARLLKSTKQLSDLNYNSLSKESTIARNKIMAEHVVAGRNMREWKFSVLAEIHDEKRREVPAQHQAHRKTQSQHVPKRAAITQRIY